MKIDKRKSILISVFIVLCLVAIYCSIKCNTIGTIISSLGSIASLYAIIEAFAKVKSIEKQNAEIKTAVETKIVALNKMETSEQISKYIEAISRIQSFINLRNADAALLKIEELQLFLHNIQCNPTTSEDTKMEITKYLRTLKQDVIVLMSKDINDTFPKEADCKTLNKHFETLHELLMKYSQQIHFEK